MESGSYDRTVSSLYLFLVWSSRSVASSCVVDPVVGLGDNHSPAPDPDPQLQATKSLQLDLGFIYFI